MIAGSAEIPAHQPIRTARLVLRPYRPDDAEHLLRYYSRDEVCRYHFHGTWTAEDAHAAVQQRMTRTDLAAGALALVVEHNGEVVGNVSSWLVADSAGTAEMGWTFSPDASGRGFATESAIALLDVTFGAPEVYRVVAQMDARNHPSARLARRLGMQQEAHLVKNCWSKGEWTDTLIFAIRRDPSRNS